MPVDLAGEANAATLAAVQSRCILQWIGLIPPLPTSITLWFGREIVKRENVYILIIFVCIEFMIVPISENRLRITDADTNIVMP